MLPTPSHVRPLNVLHVSGTKSAFCLETGPRCEGLKVLQILICHQTETRALK